MIENISDISVVGLIVPGEIYLLSGGHERVWNYGALDHMYILKEEKELLPALEMEFFIVLAGAFELVRFLGVCKIDENCYEFKFEYTWKRFKKKDISSMYLRRIPSFSERLDERKRRLEEKSRKPI